MCLQRAIQQHLQHLENNVRSCTPQPRNSSSGNSLHPQPRNSSSGNSLHPQAQKLQLWKPSLGCKHLSTEAHLRILTTGGLHGKGRK